MSPEFENMLYLFGSGAVGFEADISRCVKISKIRDIALSQNVWPVIYGAIRGKIESGEVRVPPEIYSKLEMSFSASIATNIRQIEFSKNTIRQLSDSGVKSCLYKGVTIAKLYAQPETRISGDTDILIDEADEKKAAELLKEIGYTVEKRQQHEHHMCATHNIGGLLEVHVNTMQKSCEDLVFQNKIKYDEPYIELENGICTMGINDCLLLLVTHFIKHFVKTGAGVRHMMDICLYMKHYEKEINWEKFDLLMEQLKYTTLIAAVKSVGCKYWGIEFELFNRVDDNLIERLLTDIEDGGVFGGDGEARDGAYRQFTKRRSALSEKEFEAYSINHLNKSLWHKLFPEVQYIKIIYPETKTNSLLLPIAYVKRWVKLVAELLAGEKNIKQYVYSETGNEEVQSAKERINLMEDLNMIDRS